MGRGDAILVTRLTTDGRLVFWCVGCEEPHAIPAERWRWNGSREKPTLSPSILIRSGHYADGWLPPDCWCTYNKEHADGPSSFRCGVCHSFVTDGNIQFLGDCTHAYAGKTVALEDWQP